MSAFLSSHIRATNTTYERVLLQLLLAYHFVASGVMVKLRNPGVAGDTGLEPVISRTGPYKASDGTTRITFVLHALLPDDVEGANYPTIDQAALEMTTAPVGVNFRA